MNRTKIAALLDQIRTAADEIEAALSEEKPHYHNCAIEAFDLRTGVVLYRFESVAAASRAGYNGSAISQALHGRIRSHTGLGWRAATSPALPQSVQDQLATYVSDFIAAN